MSMLECFNRFVVWYGGDCYIKLNVFYRERGGMGKEQVREITGKEGRQQLLCNHKKKLIEYVCIENQPTSYNCNCTISTISTTTNNNQHNGLSKQTFSNKNVSPSLYFSYPDSSNITYLFKKQPSVFSVPRPTWSSFGVGGCVREIQNIWPMRRLFLLLTPCGVIRDGCVPSNQVVS